MLEPICKWDNLSLNGIPKSLLFSGFFYLVWKNTKMNEVLLYYLLGTLLLGEKNEMEMVSQRGPS